MNANMYNQVKKFNAVAAQFENVTTQSLALQMDLIQEEYLELVQAFDDKDDAEYLDATADLFVTVAGLMQKLDAAGFKVAEAISRVNESNLSKFNSTGNFQPLNTNAVHNKQYDLFSFINKDTGKIMKPTNFLSVDLDGLYVKGFLSGIRDE